jgi:hypothetical protein
MAGPLVEGEIKSQLIEETLLRRVGAEEIPMKPRIWFALPLLFFMSLPIPAQEKGKRPAVTIPALIDQLTQVAESDVGYSPANWGTSFLAVDYAGSFQGGLLPLRPNVPSEAMRELVKRGAAAVPHLLAHLDDKRPTRLNVQDPFNSKKILHTVTVGDLCYVALGQIVNRGYSAVFYIPSGIVSVHSPPYSPDLRAEIIKEWGGLTPEKHKASLVKDFHNRQRTEVSTRIGACLRLGYYYPDTLEPLVLALLKQPVHDPFSVANPAGNEQPATLSSVQRSEIIAEGLRAYRSDNIDRALLSFMATTEDDDTGLACAERFLGTSHDAEIERYCKRRLPVCAGRFRDDLRTMLDKFGWTPLHVAVEKRQINVASNLLARSADVNARGRNGKTPLHLAARDGNLELVKVLTGAGADLNAKDREGKTPLDFASAWDRARVVEYLGRRGADVRDIFAAAMLGRADLVAEQLKRDPSLVPCQVVFDGYRTNNSFRSILRKELWFW